MMSWVRSFLLATLQNSQNLEKIFCIGDPKISEGVRASTQKVICKPGHFRDPGRRGQLRGYGKDKHCTFRFYSCLRYKTSSRPSVEAAPSFFAQAY
ncbi:unnamed protein product [Clavelina lepadiformis]|uniref:Secreted protein n=1 Tax=Clavelina lepadiformis TaxID=159417 RepID=A0ABP0FZE2_CLALP